MVFKAILVGFYMLHGGTGPQVVMVNYGLWTEARCYKELARQKARLMGEVVLDGKLILSKELGCMPVDDAQLKMKMEYEDQFAE